MDSGDLVFDPFAGSNTTGAVAEALGGRWMTCEADWQYAALSIVRFSADQVVRCHSFLHHQHHSTFSSAAFEAGSTVLD